MPMNNEPHEMPQHSTTAVPTVTDYTTASTTSRSTLIQTKEFHLAGASLHTRSTAMIDIDRDADSNAIVNIRVGGERLKSDDGETWFLPKGLISPDMLVNELPEDATFEL